MGTGAFLAHGHFGSSDAKFYGVELDSITGRISKQLYQKANIQVTGYEYALLPDNYFDCVIGNVPFGNFQVNDPQYNRLHFPIHDYFFAKSIDKLRTGGIMAIITSSGTLDKRMTVPASTLPSAATLSVRCDCPTMRSRAAALKL